jgi:hypothetical protein
MHFGFVVVGGLGLRVLSPAAPPPRFAMGSGAPRWCHPQTQTASTVLLYRFAPKFWEVKGQGQGQGRRTTAKVKRQVKVKVKRQVKVKS